MDLRLGGLPIVYNRAEHNWDVRLAGSCASVSVSLSSVVHPSVAFNPFLKHTEEPIKVSGPELNFQNWIYYPDGNGVTFLMLCPMH